MRKTERLKASFAVCINNSGYEASLEAGKLYRIIPDPVAAGHGYLRVIDESGEDYGYSTGRFFQLAIPETLAAALSSQPKRGPARRVRSTPGG
jgi:hypothetical protein